MMENCKNGILLYSKHCFKLGKFGEYGEFVDSYGITYCTTKRSIDAAKTINFAPGQSYKIRVWHNNGKDYISEFLGANSQNEASKIEVMPDEEKEYIESAYRERDLCHERFNQQRCILVTNYGSNTTRAVVWLTPIQQSELKEIERIVRGGVSIPVLSR